VNSVAVVIIDVQRDFLDPATPARVGSQRKAFCLPGIQKLLTHARNKKWPVYHIGTCHKDRETLPFHYQRSGGALYCAENTPGCNFMVTPLENETVLFKTSYSAFFGTTLQKELSSAATCIIWGGVAVDCCIQQSVFEADRLEFRNIVPIQAVSASSREAFVAGLLSLGKSAADILELDDIIDESSGIGHSLSKEEIGLSASSWFTNNESDLTDETEHAHESLVKT
jgi:nicotinamidase-related amidase